MCSMNTKGNPGLFGLVFLDFYRKLKGDCNGGICQLVLAVSGARMSNVHSFLGLNTDKLLLLIAMLIISGGHIYHWKALVNSFSMVLNMCQSAIKTHPKKARENKRPLSARALNCVLAILALFCQNLIHSSRQFYMQHMGLCNLVAFHT